MPKHFSATLVRKIFFFVYNIYKSIVQSFNFLHFSLAFLCTAIYIELSYRFLSDDDQFKIGRVEKNNRWAIGRRCRYSQTETHKQAAQSGQDKH